MAGASTYSLQDKEEPGVRQLQAQGREKSEQVPEMEQRSAGRNMEGGVLLTSLGSSYKPLT